MCTEPCFLCSPTPSLSDLHHKFPCLLLTGWFLFRASSSDSYCTRVCVVTVHQKEGGKWQTKRGGKGKPNIQRSQGLEGHAHNWPRVRGRAAAHPPFLSLFLSTFLSASPESPVALALLINQMVINNSNIFSARGEMGEKMALLRFNKGYKHEHIQAYKLCFSPLSNLDGLGSQVR